jgi:hypothetical protein
MDSIGFSKFDGYVLLNKIQPPYFQKSFPYNEWTKDKILLTNNELELLVKSTKKSTKTSTKKDKKDTKKDTKKDKKKKGGSDYQTHVIIYN